MPVGWSRIEFDQVASIANGLIDPRKEIFCDRPHIGPENIAVNGNRVQGELSTARELQLISGKFLIEPGDIVYSKIRPNLNKVAWVDFSGMCSADMYVLRANQVVVDQNFLFQLIQGEAFYKQAVSASMRSGLPKVNRDDLSYIILSIPPLPEQRRIVVVLDEWDRAIKVTEDLVAAKRRLFDVLLQSLLGSAQDETNALLSGWQRLTIDHMADVIGGGTPDSTNPSFWNGDVLWCIPTDLSSLRTRYISSTERRISKAGLRASSATLLPANSVVLCSRASVGVCAITTVPMATNQGFQNLVPRCGTEVAFLYYLVRANERRMVRMAAGSTFLEFSGRELRRLSVAVPEPEKQQRIGRILSTADDEIDTLGEKLAGLRMQKRGLMQKLLTGQWRLLDVHGAAA